jgi:RNA recognition motif-containing protein
MLNTEDTPPQQLPQCQQRYFRCDRIECSADDITDQAISREITPSCSIESRLSSDFTSLSSDERDKGITNVFVDGLPSHADGEWLRKTFAPFGLIIAAKVMLSLKTTYSLGYGFVQYTKPEMADHAMQSMHDVEVDGYRLTVMIAHRDKNKGISHQPSHQVDVYNLPLSCSPLNVYILFAQFGSIRSVTRLPESSNHIDDGMVWRIHYTMVENAIAAVSQLNARLLQGHDRPLELKFIRQHRKSKHHLYTSKHLDTAALE